MRKLLFIVLSALPLIAFDLYAAEGRMVVAREAVRQETLTGFTRARREMTISAETSGRVAFVAAEMGDLIDGNNPLVCLDATFVDLDIRANQTEMARLQIDIRYFRKQVKRLSELLRTNSSSESQLDEAQRNLDLTRSQLTSLRIKNETLAENKQRHCVFAPDGWYLMQRHVEPGEWITSGQPLAQAGDFSRLLVPFSLSLVELQVLEQLGDSLHLRLPDLQQQAKARITHLSPNFDQVSRKIYVELEVGERIERPRGGLKAELTLTIPVTSGSIMLPAAALTQQYEEYWLTRDSGDLVKVVYLGRVLDKEGQWVRVISPDIQPGDRFQLPD